MRRHSTKRPAGPAAVQAARQPARAKPGALPAGQTDGAPGAAAKPAPPDIDAMRRDLARELSMFAADWRRCPRGLCRRMRGCQPPEVFCISPRPEGPPMTRDKEAAMLARLKRDLARRLGTLAAKNDAGEA